MVKLSKIKLISGELDDVVFEGSLSDFHITVDGSPLKFPEEKLSGKMEIEFQIKPCCVDSGEPQSELVSNPARIENHYHNCTFYCIQKPSAANALNSVSTGTYIHNNRCDFDRISKEVK